MGKELVSLYAVPATFAVTTLTYYRNGLVKSKSDNEGRRTEYRYNDDGNLAAEDMYIDSTTWEGKVMYSRDPNQNETNYEYDQRGFLTKVTDAEDGVTAFWYDRAGRKTAEVSPKYYDASKVLEQMNRKEYAYDSMSRILAETEVYFDDREDQWISFVSKAYK